MISAIISGAIRLITGQAFDRITDLAKAYFNKEITEAQFEAEIAKAREATEQQWAASTAQMMESVQATVRVSPTIQRAYAFTVIMLIVTLAWYWWGVPAFQIATGQAWPEPMITLEWAYLLLGALLAGSPMVFRR